MANTPLTGNTISSSYQGLLKTGDSSALGATEKPIVDGLANASTMTMGTGGVSFTSGTVDFTGATVTGLPAGAAGLESGTGADSMQSAASLTTTPANASGDKSLALGDGAESPGTGAIAIGDGADTGIGADAYDNNNAIAIGVGANIANYTSGIAIGKNASTSVSFGFRKTAIGTNSNTSAQDAISLGTNTSSTANGAVALGSGVTAATADTVSVKALEVQTDSTPTAGGIIMSDAGGTDRRINIDASGALQIDSTPVGGGGAAGLESGTGADSMQSAASLTTVPANAEGSDSIALGDGATVLAAGTNGIAIGNSAVSGPGIAIGAFVTNRTSGQSVSIGHFSDATGNESSAVGYAAQATGTRSTALGSASVASGIGSIAIGRSISATADGAVALNTNATIADTVSVKALEIQTDSTPTAGGIIMSDAGGTDRRLNITATGDLQIDSTPVGGGGGGAWATPTGAFSKMLSYNIDAKHYRTWVQTTGYGRTAAASTTLDRAYYGVFSIEPGETISKVHIDVFAAAAGSTVEVAFYDMEVDANNRLYLNNQLYNVGLIPSDVTGMKNITLGTPFTWPTGKNINLLAVVLWSSDGTVQLTGWQQGIWNGGGYYAALGNIYYRAMSVHCKPGVANGTALPATIGPTSGSTVTYSADTSNPLVVGIG